MPDIRATTSTDFSLSSTWVGGVVPGSGDVAFANGFTIPISDARTVQAISNASGTGITAGGSFSLVNGANLTCTNASGVVQGTAAGSCVTINLGVGQVATLTANQSTSPGAAQTPINISGTGTINLTGNYTGAVGTSVTVASTFGGTLNIVGNLTGGSNTNCFGISVSGTTGAVINHTGIINGGTTGAGRHGMNIESTFAGTLVSTGGATASAVSSAFSNSSTSGSVTINGALTPTTTFPAIAAGVAGQGTRLTGPFLVASNGVVAVAALAWRFPTNAPPTTFQVLTATGATRILYSADNLPGGGFPATTNVRSGTIYGPTSELTGTAAIPSAANVALGVAVDNTVGTAVLTQANVTTALEQFASGRLSNVATVDTTGAQIQAAISAP
jgi:hypothetical protein